MLPDYISGTQSWEQIVKMTELQERDMRIELLKGRSIKHIDRAAKTVTGEEEHTHPYSCYRLS